jgi:hypothetical protein
MVAAVVVVLLLKVPKPLVVLEVEEPGLSAPLQL